MSTNTGSIPVGGIFPPARQTTTEWDVALGASAVVVFGAYIAHLLLWTTLRSVGVWPGRGVGLWMHGFVAFVLVWLPVGGP